MTANGGASEEALRELDARIDVMASEDIDALKPVLADDFYYTHSTGHSQTKDEWLEGLRPLLGRRQRLSSPSRVELHEDVAVAMGDLDIAWNDGRRNTDRY